MDRHGTLLNLADVMRLAAVEAREIARSGESDGLAGLEVELAAKIEVTATELYDLVSDERQ